MSMKLEPQVGSHFIGIPYKENGRNFDGVDCLGLVWLWFKEHGVVFEEAATIDGETSVFWWVANPKRYIEGITQYGNVFPFHEVKKHDVVLFFDPKNNTSMPVDAGVMVDDRHFIWMSEGFKSSVRMLDQNFKDRFWGALRTHKAQEARLD